jgi:hypothetical protein
MGEDRQMRISSPGRGSADSFGTLCAAGAILAAVSGVQACSPGEHAAQADLAQDVQAEIDRYERYQASALAAGRPSEADVDRLESQFAAVPCLGDAGRWDRTYFFGANDARDAVDKGKIDFRLREAGKYGLAAERRIVSVLSPQAMPEIDDRDYLIASGSYRIASQTLTIDACGPNI